MDKQGEASADFLAEHGVIYDKRDESETVLYTVGGGTQLAAFLGGLSGAGGGEGTHQLAVTRDSGGTVTQVEFTQKVAASSAEGVGVDLSAPGPRSPLEVDYSALEGSTQEVETTATLSADDPTDQEAVKEYLDSRSGVERPELGTRLGDLLHERGDVTRVVYEGDSETESLDAEAGVGARRLGLESETVTSSSRAVECSYLGPPDDAGKRQWVPMDDCTTGGN